MSVGLSEHFNFLIFQPILDLCMSMDSLYHGDAKKITGVQLEQKEKSHSWKMFSTLLKDKCPSEHMSVCPYVRTPSTSLSLERFLYQAYL